MFRDLRSRSAASRSAGRLPVQLVGTFVALAISALVVGACVPPFRSAPSAPVAPAPEAVAAAKRFRETFGLRSDDAWIRAVAADPLSAPGLAAYGVPLTPEEVVELDRRQRESQPVARTIQEYSESFPTQAAGVYIDQANAALVVALFTADIDLHREAIQRLVNPAARFEVRQVRWSLQQLTEISERVGSDLSWLTTIDAAYRGDGVDVQGNVVVLQISSTNPAAGELVRAHYGLAVDQLRVESDGREANPPHGTLLIKAVEPDGRPADDLECYLVYRDEPTLGSEELGSIHNGTCGPYELPVGHYSVELKRRVDLSLTIAGSAPVEVSAGQTTTVEVVVHPP